MDVHGAFVHATNMRSDLTSMKGFEWMVKDVQKLCDVIEGVGEGESSEEHEDFDILKQSPVLDNRFKLEIGMHEAASSHQMHR